MCHEHYEPHVETLYLVSPCLVFHINTIVDILSHFIITQIYQSDMLPWITFH